MNLYKEDFNLLLESRFTFLLPKEVKETIALMNQEVDQLTLEDIRQLANSIEKLLKKLPFLSRELRLKVELYQQKLQSCSSKIEFEELAQELLQDLRNDEPGSLGALTQKTISNWGAKKLLKKLGLNRGENPVAFVRSKVSQVLEKTMNSTAIQSGYARVNLT